MKTMKQVTIPPTTPEGNEGLRLSSTGIWQAKFEVGGAGRTRSTGAREGDLPAARLARDKVYSELAKAGAVVVYGKAARTLLRVKADPTDAGIYITRRPPYVTTVQGKFVGAYESAEEARVASRMVAADSLIDEIFLPEVHPAVVGAILGERRQEPGEALGVIETRTVAAVLQAADAGVTMSAKTSITPTASSERTMVKLTSRSITNESCPAGSPKASAISASKDSS